MKNKTLIGFLILVSTLIPGFVFAENVIDDSKTPGYLFVISGTSGSLDGDTLTLNGVPNVIYFSDRPDRVAGHIPLEMFVESWNKGNDSFKADPPNAVLSMLTEDEAQNVVVELTGVELKDDKLYFKVKMLEGDIKGSFENASLFIDIFIGAHPGCFAGLC